ncbi:SLBB domain-containing protein [Secundilactobacillus odoratitofui]|uniref:SLBB domain-containing protein n=1 Tax=Secundilactobacillus odoratitofui TaxID=480930 RepID=UPI0034E269F6
MLCMWTLKVPSNNPALKKVDQTMRVIDAVHLAGGFTSLADEKQINLAQRLTDSQVIYIPKRGEKNARSCCRPRCFNQWC